MSVFDRLGFNFDSEKFGSANYLPEETVNTLKITSQSDLYTWQKDRLELNTPIEITEYRQNPFGNICNSILDQVESIVAVTLEPPEGTADWTTWVSGTTNPIYLLAAAQDLVIEMEEFKNHTANLAGVSKYDSPDPNVPIYETATSYGRQVLNIVYQTDGIINSSPILGSFTSLFIEEDIKAANNLLNTDVVNSFISNPAAADAGVVTGLTSNLNSIITLVETRRLHDWNFFANVKSLLNDYMTLKKLEMGGRSNTEFSLINNFIGTETYKQNLEEQIQEEQRKEYDREYVPGTTFGTGSNPEPDDGLGPDTESCTIPEETPQYTIWSNFFGEQNTSNTDTGGGDTRGNGGGLGGEELDTNIVSGGTLDDLIRRLESLQTNR